ncbi:MAG: lysophospholipid acyltransferase family protein [Paracoccaceae bacterium]|nr:lysophospholipid acyltransferase family protein [Paracoccaceae bacterium]
MYVVLAVTAVVLAPWAAIDRRGAYFATKTYCQWVRWSAAWMIGLKSEVRGPVPDGEVLIAAKHQSFFDIILMVSVLPKPKFIYKSSLNYMPFVGSYARWLGCVPVNRGRRGEAIRNMVTAVTSSFAPPGQLIIYPQGTRVAPGVRAPFKVGIAALYIETGQACVPAATNVGVFWPRRAVYRKPGLAVVEFLPSIPSSLDKAVFMQRVQESVEENSNRLMLEAGFQIPPNVQSATAE